MGGNGCCNYWFGMASLEMFLIGTFLMWRVCRKQDFFALTRIVFSAGPRPGQAWARGAKRVSRGHTPYQPFLRAHRGRCWTGGSFVRNIGRCKS